MPRTLPPRVRLAGYEFNLKTGELRGGAQTVRLAEKPFRVLLILVEGGGDLVTREEIQKKLWPGDTVVDFEHGINTAIKVLRRSLGDSAEDPKYIETIPRRGYRLMVPVERVDSSSGDELPVEASSGQDETAAQIKLESAALIGKTVSHYRVLHVIGGGGMGVVYKAEDLKLGRAVALKFLPDEVGSDLQALERFQREARTASSLNHPNICTIYEIEEHAGHPFIVMELLEGRTLRDRLADATSAAERLSIDQVLNIALQISDGLEAAHEKGIIHRDIKPANIFITNKGVTKILDFGLAKFLQPGEEPSIATETDGKRGPPPPPVAGSEASNLSRAGVAVGTAAYMSPEQIRGEMLDARTDLFSFGLVLYEMATGQHAFSGETLEIVHNGILNRPQIPVHDLNPSLAAELGAAINKALQKNRQHRYQSAMEMREAFRHLRGETERDRFGKRGTESREAYLLRTKAVHWANKWTQEAVQKSLQYIQQAIDADPTYAEAYCDLGYMFAVLGMFEYAPPSQMFPRAQAAVRKALQIDHGHAGAHAVLAFTHIVFDWDFASGEYEARRAIALAPQDASGYYAYSQWCLTQCRLEEAVAAARQSLELDPLTLFKSYHLGSTYLYARRYADAIEHLKQTLEIGPSFWMGHGVLALAYARNGNYEEAIAAIDRCANVSLKAILGTVEALAGKRDEARAIIEELMKEQSVSARMRYRIAGIHAELGELDDAFGCLGKALDGRTPQIVYLAADPGFDKLRDDPRWGNLLRRVGLVST